MTDFLEDPPFPRCPSFGFTSEPMYDVTVVTRGGGFEKRNRNWQRPRHRYTAVVGPRAQADVEAVLEFYHAVGGRAVGFRFSDGNDYQSASLGSVVSPTDQPLVLVTGSSPEEYQLVKRYTAGVLSQDREIVKPVAGTVRIADAGVEKDEMYDWTLDYASGRVTLNFMPVGVLTWGGEFDVPVRFDSELPVELQNRQILSASFVLMELRPQEFLP
jgi:uncharacterized protein (TIGR02217 family)